MYFYFIWFSISVFLQRCSSSHLAYSVIWYQSVSLGVDYIMANYDDHKSVKVPDSRFPVIRLDGLNKTTKRHRKIFGVPAEIRTWRLYKPEALALAPYSQISAV
jgi:hypothetical protein